MSSTMNVNIELRDCEALKAACKRLGLKVVEGTHKLFASTETGLGIFLKGWQYPVVVKDDGKEVSYDNYEGKWGGTKELNKLKAYYGIEKAKREALRKGYSYYESKNHADKPQLRIQIGE